MLDQQRRVDVLLAAQQIDAAQAAVLSSPAKRTKLWLRTSDASLLSAKVLNAPWRRPSASRLATCRPRVCVDLEVVDLRAVADHQLERAMLT